MDQMPSACQLGSLHRGTDCQPVSASEKFSARFTPMWWICRSRRRKPCVQRIYVCFPVAASGIASPCSTRELSMRISFAPDTGGWRAIVEATA